MKRKIAAFLLVLLTGLGLSACAPPGPSSPCPSGYSWDADDFECEPDDAHPWLMPYPVILNGSGHYVPKSGVKPYATRPGYKAPPAWKPPAYKPPVFRAPAPKAPVFRAPAPAPRPVFRSK